MNELTLDGKMYVSSKRAAELSGYAKDYIGQMCREGRIEARLVGRNWYVLKSALEKHRFSPDSKGTGAVKANEPISISGNWENPRYELEVPGDLPPINKLAEARIAPVEASTVLEQEQAPVLSTIETMQEAWRGWFTREQAPEEFETVADEAEIAQEAIDEPESIETPITIRTIDGTTAKHEQLNLRRIREYQDDTAEEEEVVIREYSVEDPKPRSYAAVRASLLVVMGLAIIIGYIGSGFAPEVGSSRPLSLIAGVSVYNRDK